MLCTKVTFLILYLELFRPVKIFRGLIYLGIFLLVGFYCSVLIAQMIFMTPHRGENFKTHSIFSRKAVLRTEETAIPAGIFGILIDIYILLLPILAVLRLQLSIKRKIGLCLVFGTGSMLGSRSFLIKLRAVVTALKLISS